MNSTYVEVEEISVDINNIKSKLVDDIIPDVNVNFFNFVYY